MILDNQIVAMQDSPGGVTSQTWQEIESQRRQEADFRQKIHKYETGERGTLQPVFCSTMIDWLEFCSSLSEYPLKH